MSRKGGHSPVLVKFPDFSRYFSQALIFVKPPEVYRLDWTKYTPEHGRWIKTIC